MILTCKGSAGYDQGFGQFACGLSIQLPLKIGAQVLQTLRAMRAGAKDYDYFSGDSGLGMLVNCLDVSLS